MKYLLIALILGTVSAPAQVATGQNPASESVSAVAPPGSTAASNTIVPQKDANGQQAAKLLDQCIAALGGDAYLNLQDMQQQGRSYTFYHGEPRSVGTPYWRFWKWPDKERVELTKKRDVVEIFNGDKGYEITFRGTAAQEPETLREYLRQQHYSLASVLRQWVRAPGTALFLNGTAVAERKPAQSVSILNSKDEQVTLFLDSETHLPIKKSFSWRDPKDRRYQVQEEEIYDNYKPIQGLMTPFSVVRRRDGEIVSQRFIDSVSYNTGVADSMFQATVTWNPYVRSGPRQ
jgi:hypothetical protein